MAMSSAINASDPFIVAFIDFFLDVPREVEDMASSLRDRGGKFHEEANGLTIRRQRG
jgi:hypothetical protein